MQRQTQNKESNFGFFSVSISKYRTSNFMPLDLVSGDSTSNEEAVAALMQISKVF